jgi:hypothetical protein
MEDIFTHFRNRFAEMPALAGTTPLVSESVLQSDSAFASYQMWKKSGAKQDLLRWLAIQLMLVSNSPKSAHESIDYLVSSTSKGFRLHPALTRFQDSRIEHLFHFLNERLQELSYFCYQSDTRTFDQPYWQEKILRFALRPVSTKSGNSASTSDNDTQQFASITIELIYKDNHLVNLRLDSVVPNTDLPRSTTDFEDLMQLVLTA